MNRINTLRHEEVFSASLFGARRVDVIGAGAVGSAIIMQLAKLGIENIHVWDYDTVESHNLANQRYNLSDVGCLKVEAIARLVKEATGLELTIHQAKVEGGETLGDIVFLAVDSMAARKAIWQKSIRLKLNVKLMIETRMGAEEGRVYSISPIKPAHLRGYEKTLYDDAVAVASACGSTITVGSTAEVTAGYALWQFMRWAAIESKDQTENNTDVLHQELIFGLRTPYIMATVFQ